MDSAAWGFLGVLIGAASSIAATLLTNWNAYRLERERARLERVEQAKAFQRDTLLSVQDEIHDAIRLVHKVHIEDLIVNRTAQVWGRNMLPEDVNEEVRLSLRRVFLLVERIIDDNLRHSIKDLMTKATKVLRAQSEEESLLCIEATGNDANKVFDQLGTVLRNHL